MIGASVADEDVVVSVRVLNWQLAVVDTREPDLDAARLSVDGAIAQCPDADGPAGEHLRDARRHLRQAAQHLEAQEVLK